jgi:hypothetical protein
MKQFAMFMLMLISGVANGGTSYLPVPPSPQPGLFPIGVVPYTFVTGFSTDGTMVEGVCGYYGYNNIHAWFNCSWDLKGASLGLGAEICCNAYGEHAPQAVYGPFGNYLGDVAGTRTPSNGGRPYLTVP